MKLSKKIIQGVEDVFKDLKKGVTLKYFTQEVECLACQETRELLEELAKLTDKIKLEVYDFVGDKAEVDKYKVDKIPAIVMMDETDYGIRFFGIPSGYEFTSLIEAIKLISTGETMLSAEGKKFLDGLGKDIHLQVFVTPTCPYCPSSVVLAHHMAYYSPRVRADMIESTEFPQLAVKYDVMGVPRTIINEIAFLEGAGPESMLIEKIKTVL
ncbi:MAG TPA: thioredoxin family protein [Candidatus Kapabacteria bacterium]|nr:thioredoxin family protein [Candidatus Kapabacteria bacterium]